MSIKTYKPYTPSRRAMTWYSFDEITRRSPEKSLTRWKNKNSGKNHKGETTSRFRGGGHKRRYRLIDRSQADKKDIPAKVVSVEYDPFRTAYIALLQYVDGEKRYVLAWKNITIGETVVCSDKEDIRLTSGNRTSLKNIPESFTIYNLEFTPHTKWKIVKAAGESATVTGKDAKTKHVLVRLPSWEIRKFHEDCLATLGELSNEEHKNIVVGKAWRSRRLWKKPANRGKSMNPVDHPHGGGEGRTSIGLKYPKAFNGRVVAPGIKTRHKKKRSNSMIVSKRKSKRRKK